MNYNILEYLELLEYKSSEEDMQFVEELCSMTRCRASKNMRFGWESCYLFLALARKIKPTNFLEFGSGRGTTSFIMAMQDSVKVVDSYDIVPSNFKQNTWFMFNPIQMSLNEFADAVLGDNPVREKIKFYCEDTSKKEFNNSPYYDIIYIDGSHDCAPVVHDYKNAMKLIKPGGLIIFDDYKRSLPGVRVALDNFILPKHKDHTVVSLCGHIYGPHPEPHDEGHVIIKV